MLRTVVLLAVAAAASAAAEPPPWGELRRHSFTIAPTPAEWPESETMPTAQPWIFHGLDRGGVEAFLLGAGVERGSVERALAGAVTADGATTLRPPTDVVLALSGAARERVYGRLALEVENQDQVCASRWTDDGFARVLAAPGLAPATVALIRRLAYRDERLVALADLPAICSLIPDAAERRRLLCAVVSSEALVVSLRLHAAGGDEQAIAWWSAGDAGVERFLRAVAARHEDVDVDLDQLLPPMPRARLNRYPLADEWRYDCGWTALNFFEPRPSADRTDPAVVARELRDHWRGLQPGESRRYGDIVLFALADGRALHAAVYLADDLVFTKNGATIMRPWKIIDLASLRVRYHAAPLLMMLRDNRR